MALDGLSYGGLGLATPAITAVDLSGTLSLPERVGENVPVPGRHGMVRAPRKKYGGRIAPFEIQVRGVTAAGLVPADPRAQVYANLRELGAALAVDAAPLVHVLPDGSQRQVTAECRAAVEPTRAKLGTLVRIPVAFESHEAFWRALATTTVGPFGLTTGSTRLLTEFATSDGTIDDPVITFGSGSNPVLTDVATGVFIAYDDVIGAGRTLVLNCATWQGSGTGGLVFDRTKLRVSAGEGRWFALDPVRGSAPTVRLTHTGGGSMQVTIAARQSWLFG
jgi:hypothetical protein